MAQSKRPEVLTREQLDGYIQQAAAAAGYAHFGMDGCDLEQRNWWAAYVRQSLEEQAQNNRIPEYLLTCARLAKDKGVVVPRQYIFVDHESSAHLDRRYMAHLRTEVIARRKIAGVLIPLQGRLTADAAQQSIFERECSHYGVELLFGDAPSGSDWGSRTSRIIMAQAQELRLTTNRDNVRAGNIGRVLKGMVPSCAAAYGYRYCRDAEIGPEGRVHIKRAWWEVNRPGPDGAPLENSPAWVVNQIFHWIGVEERSFYWVAKKLNGMGIKAPEGGNWSISKVSHIAHHSCYTGEHAYNSHAKVPNPDRPLADVTARTPRTLLRPKPEKEWVRFKVPQLVSQALWQKADAVVSQRGRGRGKQGKVIQALIRNRIFCPRCGRPMGVRRYKRRHQELTYYYCSRYFRPWAEKPCSYGRFVPAGQWDDLAWDAASALLQDDAWLEVELASKESQGGNAAKLIKIQEVKMKQAQAKMAKIREGFEGGLYGLDEAKRRIDEYQHSADNAEEQIRRLQKEMGAPDITAADLEALRQELNQLRTKNLDAASFDEKREIVTRLGMKVYPSEDLKSVRIACGANFTFRGDGQSDGGDCRKVVVGPP